MEQLGLHGLRCRKSQGHHSPHAAVNELLRRASARVPSHLEPSGIMHSDGKREYGATVMPWKHGWTLVWDATCQDTLAPSHVALAAREACTVAKQGRAAEDAEVLPPHHHSPYLTVCSGDLRCFWSCGPIPLVQHWFAHQGRD